MSGVVQRDAPRNPSSSSRGINTYLTLSYTNCRSIKNKVIDLLSTTASFPTNSIILLTETLLDPGVLDGELPDPALHAVFRNDRRSRGGGVLIASPACLSVIRRHDLESPDIAVIFLELHLPCGIILLGCVYCPPRTRDAAYQLLDAFLRRASITSYRDILTFADYNIRTDWWSQDEPIPSDDRDDSPPEITSSCGL